LPHGIKSADGFELPADEIIFATGYKNMRTQRGRSLEMSWRSKLRICGALRRRVKSGQCGGRRDIRDSGSLVGTWRFVGIGRGCWYCR
jgi:hypothetical protein